MYGKYKLSIFKLLDIGGGYNSIYAKFPISRSAVIMDNNIRLVIYSAIEGIWATILCERTWWNISYNPTEF